MKILDSTIIIDFLKGQPNAIELMERNKSEVATTTINQFEVLYGIHKRAQFKQDELHAARRFFENIDIFPFDSMASSLSAEMAGALVKKGSTLAHDDCRIAAIALRNNVTIIITQNKKDFQKIKGIQVETY